MQFANNKTEVKTTNAKKKSQYWLNVTLTKGKKRVQFGIALDYFLEAGAKATEQQQKFIKAQIQKGAGVHELEGWEQKLEVNIVSNEPDDEDDDWS